MRYKIMAAIFPNIAENLSGVRIKIADATQKRIKVSKDPCLVAVSKTKPLQLIKIAYEAGQKNFGENYIKELILKSNNPDINELCPGIKWHYVGAFTKKQASSLMRVSNLHMLETLPGKEEATAVNKRWQQEKPLNVLVQVNTSGEESKSGATEANCCEIVRFIVEKCPNLKFCGLMTIGARGHDYSKGPNPDFTLLSKLRTQVSDDLGCKEEDLELSMGMSGDYEEAIEAGSTIIRIGSTIFGARD